MSTDSIDGDNFYYSFQWDTKKKKENISLESIEDITLTFFVSYLPISRYPKTPSYHLERIAGFPQRPKFYIESNDCELLRHDLYKTEKVVTRDKDYKQINVQKLCVKEIKYNITFNKNQLHV